VTSFTLGRKLGRGFLVRHGARLKITEERLEQVERFFERHGGPTILIGRFIGLVRAIAPFIAGASGFPLSRFLAYDILGAGMWASTFCVLGFVFWRSFDKLTHWVSRGLLGFAVGVAFILAVVFAVRLYRDEELRERTRAKILEALEQPLLRPFKPFLLGTWHRVVHPLGRHVGAPLVRVVNRLLPGRRGLELIGLGSVAAVGIFGLVALGMWQASASLPSIDRWAFSVADSIYDGDARRAVIVVSALGSLPAVIVLTLLVAGWAAGRGHRAEALALVAGLVVTWALVEVLKAAYDRPRPPDAHVGTHGASYPAAYAAYAVAWVACLVAVVRSGVPPASRVGLVAAAVIVAVVVGATRIYLRANYLTDVLGGLGLGAAVFALCAAVAMAVEHLRHNVPERA
jgi:undecaprenyl-diphosphatase